MISFNAQGVSTPAAVGRHDGDDPGLHGVGRRDRQGGGRDAAGDEPVRRAATSTRSASAGVVEKCTFCYHRTSNGLQPACVEVCPSKARIFGDQDDANSEIAKVLKAQKSFRLQEDKGTKPNVHYVGKYSARA